MSAMSDLYRVRLDPIIAAELERKILASIELVSSSDWCLRICYREIRERPGRVLESIRAFSEIAFDVAMACGVLSDRY